MNTSQYIVRCFHVRPAGVRSKECKSLIRPAVGRVQPKA